MSGSNDTYRAKEFPGGIPGNRGVVASPPPLQSSATEIVNRAIWEPYFRFLLFCASVWRNWYWSIPLGAILGGCLGAVGFLTTPLFYPSQSWVQMHYQRKHVAFPDMNVAREEYPMFVATQLVLFRSDMVIRPAWAKIVHDAKSEGVDIGELLKKEEPARWLSKRLQLTAEEGSQIYVVGFETANPKLSQFVVESILSSYFDYLKRSNQDSANGLISDLKHYAENKQADIAAIDREYRTLINKITENGGRIPSEKDMQMEYDSLYNDVAKIDAEIEAKKVELEYNKNATTREVTIPDTVVESLVYSDPQMVQLLSEKYKYLDQLEKKIKMYASPNDSVVLAAKKKVDDVERQIEQLSVKLLPDAKVRWLAGIRQDAQSKVLLLEEEIRSLERMGSTLQDRRREKFSGDSSMSGVVLDATNTRFRMMREEEVYNTLLTRINVLTTENNSPSRVELLSPRASITDYPDTSKRNRTAVIYAMLGFLIPTCLAWGRELLTARFYHMAQLRLLYPNALLREIHGMPRPGLGHVLSGHSARLFQQSVEEVCNDFCYGKNYQGAKIFFLSSARLDDGQALLTVNIAEKMAQIKKEPVLLIDTHFQNDRIRNLMGVQSIRGGLADVLALRVSINDAIIRDESQPNLHFLPAATSDAPAIDFYGDGKMGMLLEELARHYSMIFITAPPFRASPGSYTLANYANATVFVMRLYDTNRSQAEKVYQQLYDMNSAPNGFLVAGVSDKAY